MFYEDDDMSFNFGEWMKYYRSQEGWDEETKTYKEMRVEALERQKYKHPLCLNVLREAVYIGNCPDVQEYMREHEFKGEV